MQPQAPPKTVRLLTATLVVWQCAASLPLEAQTSTAAPSDLVGWWPGDDNTLDLAGGVTATPVGGPGFVADGKGGAAMRFDGVNQCHQLATSGLVKGLSEATIEAWVRPRGPHGFIVNGTEGGVITVPSQSSLPTACPALGKPPASCDRPA